jgi:hypothetical protein
MEEVRSGRREAQPVLKEILHSVFDGLTHRVQDTQEELANSIRGLVESSNSKEHTIAELEQQAQRLQVQIDRDERELNSQVEKQCLLY